MQNIIRHQVKGFISSKKAKHGVKGTTFPTILIFTSDHFSSFLYHFLNIFILFTKSKTFISVAQCKWDPMPVLDDHVNSLPQNFQIFFSSTGVPDFNNIRANQQRWKMIYMKL